LPAYWTIKGGEQLIGRILGKRYEIVEEIGSGGMAVVYRALDRLLNRVVTVKILREQYAEDEEFVQRFHREAQAVASLSHPNIVGLYDVGAEGKLHYLVMEYVPGKSLKQLIKEEAPLELNKAIEIMRQILDALQHAHENNIVHRDVKPHNILLTPGGRIKVTDFGISRAATGITLTYTGSMVGSVHYISPEQARGKLTTIRSDIYSAGVVLYEMLTGCLPFSGEGPIAIAMKHIESEVAPPSQLNPQIPRAVEKVILKAMAKMPEHRFASAREMSLALSGARYNQWDQADAGPAAEKNEAEMKVVPQTQKQRKMKPLAWVLVVLVLLGLGYLAYWGTLSVLTVEDVEVPEVVGKNLAEAQRILAQQNLEAQKGRELYDEEVPEGRVVRQDPPPGSMVKSGRAVILDMSLGPKMRELPNVVGYKERQAILELQNEGFEIEQVIEINHPEVPAGEVVDQEPRAGEMIPEGSAVTLTVSQGKALVQIAMPDLVGETLADAIALLEENRLQLGSVTEVNSERYFAGEVTGQDVAPQTPILQGSTVNLEISKGPGPPAYHATVKEIRVPDDGEDHVVRVLVNDWQGNREEYRQAHPPGAIVSVPITFFGEGTVEVFIDEQLYDRKTIQPND